MIELINFYQTPKNFRLLSENLPTTITLCFKGQMKREDRVETLKHFSRVVFISISISKDKFSLLEIERCNCTQNCLLNETTLELSCGCDSGFSLTNDTHCEGKINVTVWSLSKSYLNS